MCAQNTSSHNDKLRANSAKPLITLPELPLVALKPPFVANVFGQQKSYRKIIPGDKQLLPMLFPSSL